MVQEQDKVKSEDAKELFAKLYLDSIDAYHNMQYAPIKIGQIRNIKVRGLTVSKDLHEDNPSYSTVDKIGHYFKRLLDAHIRDLNISDDNIIKLLAFTDFASDEGHLESLAAAAFIVSNTQHADKLDIERIKKHLTTERITQYNIALAGLKERFNNASITPHINNQEMRYRLLPE